MRKTVLLSLILCLLFSLKGCTQSLDSDKLDSLLDLLETNNKAMVSVAISKNGNVLYSKATGYASISSKEKIPATVHTLYRIGSITKMFTATMIFQLVEEKKLKLDATLETYFPTIPNSGQITIENLLNHRSGIHNFTDEAGFEDYMTQAKTQQEMVAIIAAGKSDFSPGQKASYSNSNYVLLGYIIEKITGKSYAENLKSRILDKIQLKETYYGGKINPAKHESYSYTFNGKWTQMPESDMSIPAGAGALVSTPTELNKFITALFSGKLISEASLNQMKTITDGYGMGLFQVPFEYRKGYGHNGKIDEFASSLYYFPDDSLAVAICSNGLSYAMNDILIAMLGTYYKRPFSLPEFKTISLKPEALNPYLGTYSCPQLPFMITVAKEGNILTAKATGQPLLKLDAVKPDVFRFDKAGIEMEFFTAKSEFVLKQAGGTYVFKREY
ncbi:serine hydrolase domain-containing protein [Dyadobacter sediminis]|uniref:Beta-lactamase family protein n=1 Tax=Dyadobacter sediminis TaxID=1493691 RepID=A0A5R9KKQ9_9BACT|nr:serine hydrolase domain-containing protein [Dyadobacter sediminis]TLU96808.1 beta-lactamase family protein [Dyadobacter sediminis]GGB85313.1 D-Ala-D-Ala carboxypeptidase [Dyadobacter sediminis]